MRYQFATRDGLITEADEYYLVRCANFRDPVGPPLGSKRAQYLSVGITKRFVENAMRHRNTYLLGRLFGIIPVELPRITSAHKGLKRPMRVEQDSQADDSKVVVVMHPTKDGRMVFHDDGTTSIEETDTLGRRVFVALLSPNGKTERYPGVDFWLENCNWVDCERDAPRYPDRYMTRYKKPCVWVGTG